MGFQRKGTNVVKIKHHSLTGRITVPLMYLAFRNVRRNRGAAGIDRESIDAFELNLDDNLLALMRRLKEGSYKPLPLRRVWIPKGPGQTRPLGIPAVRDRVAQEVVRLLLSPLFERLFHEDSYGFRPGRDCHMAMGKVLELHQQGHLHVLDADIKGFFDNLPHSVIMAGVAAEVADPEKETCGMPIEARSPTRARAASYESLATCTLVLCAAASLMASCKVSG